MSAAYSADIETARMNAVLAGIDGGGGAGSLEICSAGYASILAVLPLAYPCGAVVADALVLDTTPPLEDSSANNTGAAALGRIKDSTGAVKVQGLTVGTGGTDIILGTTAITAGLKVQVTAGQITHS